MLYPLPRLGEHKKSILIIALSAIGSVIGVYIYHIIVPTQIPPGAVVGYLNRYDTRGHGPPCYNGPLANGGHRATCRTMIDHLSDKLGGATDYAIMQVLYWVLSQAQLKMVGDPTRELHQVDLAHSTRTETIHKMPAVA